MDNIAEALLKAGVISREKIEEEKKKEKDKKNQEIQKQLEEEFKQRQEQQQKKEQEEEKFKLIKNLYINKKQFIAHLVYAFSPIRIAQRWWVEALFTSCPICGVTILTLNEAFHPKKMDDYCNLNLDLLHQIIKMEINSKQTDVDVENVKKIIERMKSVYNGKQLGVCSPDSDKVLCQPCHQNLCEWMIKEMLMDNRHINAIIHNKIQTFKD
jgi:hypothetical protein